MGRGTNWPEARIAELLRLRDVEKLRFHEIGKRLGTTAASAGTRYNYHSAKRRIVEATARVRAESADGASMPPVVVPRAPAPPPASVVAAQASPEVVQRRRYFHDADNDMRARIARMGLTGGLFGDPPPGRSALDQREGRK